MRRPARRLRLRHAARLEFVWNKCVLRAVHLLTWRGAAGIEQCHRETNVGCRDGELSRRVARSARAAYGKQQVEIGERSCCRQGSRTIVLLAMANQVLGGGRTDNGVWRSDRAGSWVPTHPGPRDSAPTDQAVPDCTGCNRGTSASPNQPRASSATRCCTAAMGVGHKLFIRRLDRRPAMGDRYWDTDPCAGNGRHQLRGKPEVPHGHP